MLIVSADRSPLKISIHRIEFNCAFGRSFKLLQNHQEDERDDLIVQAFEQPWNIHLTIKKPKPITKLFTGRGADLWTMAKIQNYTSERVKEFT